MAIWRVLERRGLLRVRAALAERDIWLRIAPHLVRPMRFAIPAHSDERPPWLLRSGLLALRPALLRAAACRLPPPSTSRIIRSAMRLKRPFGTAFEYSDCVVDDSRLVVAQRRSMPPSAAPRSVPARAASAPSELDIWRLAVIDRGQRQRRSRHGRWPTPPGLDRVGRGDRAARAAAARWLPIQMSQIIVRRLFDTDNVYVFQNSDGRLIFASPYERDFTLIGTVGHAFKGDPAIVSMPAADVAYLCEAANRYFRERVDPSDVVRTVSGANMAVGPASARRARRRDACSMRRAARRRC